MQVPSCIDVTVWCVRACVCVFVVCAVMLYAHKLISHNLENKGDTKLHSFITPRYECRDERID
jgi:hypothetical protein